MNVISNDSDGERARSLARSRGRPIDLRNLPHLFAILYISPREESFYLHELRVLKGILLNPESSQTTYHARRFHLALFRPALIPRTPFPPLPPSSFLSHLPPPKFHFIQWHNLFCFSCSSVFSSLCPSFFFFPFLSPLSLFLLFFFCPRIDNERRYIINANKIAGIEYPRKICKEGPRVYKKTRPILSLDINSPATKLDILFSLFAKHTQRARRGFHRA